MAAGAAAGATIGALQIGLTMATAPFLAAVQQVTGAMRQMVFGFARVSASNIDDFFENATMSAINFETQMALLKTTTGLQGDALGHLGEQIRNLGHTMSGVDLESLFGVATFAGRIGIATENITEFTRNVGMVSVVLRDIPAEEIALRMQQILDVFGLGTEKALGFASALNELDKRSKATGREILQMTNQMAGHAVILGISVQKTMALAAAMRDAGIEVAIGTTAVDQVFARMATHTKEFAAVAQAADPSITFERFAEVLKTDAISALGMFVKGLREFDQISQFKVLDAMNLEGRRTAGTLLKLGSQFERLAGYARIADDQFASGASILRDYATMAETTEAKQQRLANILTIMSASMGTKLLPIVNALIDAVGHLADGFTSFLERHKGEIDAWANDIRKVISLISLIGDEFTSVIYLIILELEDFSSRMLMVGANMAVQFWRYFVAASYTAVLSVLDILTTAFMDFADATGATFMERLMKKMSTTWEYAKAMAGVESELPFDATKPGAIGEEGEKLRKSLEEKLKAVFHDRERMEHPETIEDPELRKSLMDAMRTPEEVMADFLKGAGAEEGDISTKEGGRAKLHGERTFEEHHHRKGSGTYALAEYYKALQSGSMEDDAKKTRGFIEDIARGKAVLAVRVAGGPAAPVPALAGP